MNRKPFDRYLVLLLEEMPPEARSLESLLEKAMRFGWRARGIEDISVLNTNEDRGDVLDDIRSLDLPLEGV